jgi:hypothetical protein
VQRVAAAPPYADPCLPRVPKRQGQGQASGAALPHADTAIGPRTGTAGSAILAIWRPQTLGFGRGGRVP